MERITMDALQWNDGKTTVYGKELSQYALEHGFIDYRCLAEIVGDMVLCNEMPNKYYLGEGLELHQGDYCYYVDGDGEEITYEEYAELDDGEELYYEFYQWFIISARGAEDLARIAPYETVFYCEELDIYVWAISHYGTSWDYVLTDTRFEVQR